jgi:hypothetical protein
MLPIQSFTVSAASWQNFYLLTGTAAATLIGLMFVAVTFGASLVTPDKTSNTRAFIDPTFYHFTQVLLTACLFVIPTMSARVFGATLVVIAVFRSGAMLGIYRRMKETHAKFADLELSDWISGVVLPVLCHALLGVSGAAFIAGYALAFEGLAVATIVMLLLGIFGAWELMLWMAFTRASRPQ